MRFCTYLVQRGLISAEDGFRVLAVVCEGTPPLGQLATSERMLTIRQLSKLLSMSAENPRPLGSLAVQAGFLARYQLTELLELQRQRTPRSQDVLVELGIMGRLEVRAAFKEFLDAPSPLCLT